MKVVLADLWKINLDHSLENNCLVDAPNQLKKGSTTTYVLAQTNEHLASDTIRNASLYLPYSALTIDHLAFGQRLYFDLENYPFYQRVVELIGEHGMKGILRYRRTLNSIEDTPLFIGDLYILTSLLGKPVDIQVKQTKGSQASMHTICLIHFGNGRLAHIECTLSKQERIEFEWSGVNKIIEFDSHHMEPIHPSQNASLSMTYSLDSILRNAHEVTEELIGDLDYIKDLLDGGRLV